MTTLILGGARTYSSYLAGHPRSRACSGLGWAFGDNGVGDRSEESSLWTPACVVVYLGYLAAIAWLGLRTKK